MRWSCKEDIMRKKNDWSIIGEDEIKAAMDKFNAIKSEAAKIDEPERAKFIHDKLSGLTQNELYAITATIMFEKN